MELYPTPGRVAPEPAPRNGPTTPVHPSPLPRRSPPRGAARFASLLGLLLLQACGPQPHALAQTQQSPEPDPTIRQAIEALLLRPEVQSAFQWLEAKDAETLRDQIELTEIPAPPFGEEVRAEAFRVRLAALGPDEVWIDGEGNVLARLRGTEGKRTVAVSGHLDTVFPIETDVTVRMSGDTLFAPGIADDGRGIASVLALLRVMRAQGLRTRADLLFIGTVGEEGLGDLRGVKHLFGPEGPGIDAFISIDGTSDQGITHMALGSFRYRVTFEGPGGHSWGAFGLGNPVHALGRAIALLDARGNTLTQAGPRTSYTVGRIGGGTSVNAIPFEAWMEVDMRSEDQGALETIDLAFRTAMQEALDEANRIRRDGAPLRLTVERIGDRPSGEIPLSEPFLQRAIAATLALGLTPEYVRSSTDSNVPISLGIPSMTLGGGGIGGRAHALDEFYINANGPRGLQRLLLLLLAEAGLEPAVGADAGTQDAQDG
jgi:tripeptide aminopeptidase